MFKYLYLFPIPFILTIAEAARAVTSAELYRTSAQTYGRFEARIQFASGDGVISSFFLWKDGSEKSDVYWNELDFEKLGAACELQTNSIYGLPERGHEEGDYALGGLCEGYHTYAYEWTPEHIAWFVDGTEIRRDTEADAAAYAENATQGLQFRFNVWPGNGDFGGNFSEAILPVYQFVAWAQYSEYTPGAGDGGSDFTLAWREEFDTPPTGWEMGSWDSPLEGSTHSAENVVFVGGVAVLALTADDATGYAGNPPPDSTGVPSTGGTGGGTGGAVEPATGGAASPSTGGAVAAPTGGAASPSGGARTLPVSGDGSSCRLAPSQSRRWDAFALLACAALGWLGRRRTRAVGPNESARRGSSC